MASDITSGTPAYVVNMRWFLEGILVPSVGIVGILGMIGISTFSSMEYTHVSFL